MVLAQAISSWFTVACFLRINSDRRSTVDLNLPSLTGQCGRNVSRDRLLWKTQILNLRLRKGWVTIPNSDGSSVSYWMQSRSPVPDCSECFAECE